LKDPVAEAVIDQNKERVKRDVDAAMKKLRSQIHMEAAWAVEVSEALEGHGRDWFAYAPLQSWSRNLGQLLDAWDESWTLEATAGLLMDLCLAMSRVIKGLPSDARIMNQHMAESRQPNMRVKRDSDWAKGLPEGAKVQAGASASTGIVLRTLHRLDVTTMREIEAIMNALYHYWNNYGEGSSWGTRLKQAQGDYHTASEIWASYMFFLEKYQNLWMPMAKL